MRQKEEKHMEERMMDTIVEIYNHMDDSDKDAFTLGGGEEMGDRKRGAGGKRVELGGCRFI